MPDGQENLFLAETLAIILILLWADPMPLHSDCHRLRPQPEHMLPRTAWGALHRAARTLD